MGNTDYINVDITPSGSDGLSWHIVCNVNLTTCANTLYAYNTDIQAQMEAKERKEREARCIRAQLVYGDEEFWAFSRM